MYTYIFSKQPVVWKLLKSDSKPVIFAIILELCHNPR